MKRLAIVVLVAVAAVSGETRAETLRYFCLFDSYADPEGVHPTKDFKLEFVRDTVTKKAVVIGNNGFEEVTALPGPYALTFIEMLPTGVAQTTTIVNTSNDAVHSRHTVLLPNPEIVPSQYYGKCKVLKEQRP